MDNTVIFNKNWQNKLSENEIHIWKCRLDLSPNEISELKKILSAEEIKRAQRFKFEKHARRFIAAKGQLRIVLGNYLKISPAAIEFKTGTHGKPELVKQLPEFPLYFNSSDSEELALFAICQESSIGVDIEFIQRDIEALAIGARFFSDNEFQLLKNAGIDNHVKIFFKIWTMKEAFIKSIGLGLSFPLKDFDVSFENNTSDLKAIRNTNLNHQDWFMTNFDTEEGYEAAVAVKNKEVALKFFI